jgi:hypothetical protein
MEQWLLEDGKIVTEENSMKKSQKITELGKKLEEIDLLFKDKEKEIAKLKGKGSSVKYLVIANLVQAAALAYVFYPHFELLLK